MNPEAQSTPRKQSWQKMRDTNLVRYVPSGVFYARVRVQGKFIRQSLKTKSITVARLRLKDFINDIRSNPLPVNQAATFRDLSEEFLEKSKNNYRIKPQTKKYHCDCVASIEKHFNRFFLSNIAKLTQSDCSKLAESLARKYGATRFNGIISTLRGIFNIAVENGCRYDNPAVSIKRARVPKRELQLPSEGEFRELVVRAEEFSAEGSLMIQFLAYSGCRIDEARHIQWGDVTQNEIIIRGDPETGTKNSEIRHVPIIPPMRELLLKHRPKDTTKSGRILKSDSCRKTLKNACDTVGTPRLTHHDLRHLFATRCIESGVEIPTVSRWLGHKDGGALAMKTYGHLRNEHSIKMAERVAF